MAWVYDAENEKCALWRVVSPVLGVDGTTGEGRDRNNFLGQGFPKIQSSVSLVSI